MNYYNDFEPFACESIRRNIARGRLGTGRVDGRSIVEVQPADLDGFTICHFFAGIAGFELARLMAGWPDDRELWTGGFPCQDISCAGKGEGLDGQRSGLWFEFLRLIRSCRPARLLVENVPALRTRGADEVLDGLEGAGYSARPIVVGAHAVGAPHRRNRVWIVCELADAELPSAARFASNCGATETGQENSDYAGRRCGSTRTRNVADASIAGLEGRRVGPVSGGEEVAMPARSRFPGWPTRPGEPQHEWEEPRLVCSRGVAAIANNMGDPVQQRSEWRDEEAGNSIENTGEELAGKGRVQRQGGAEQDPLRSVGDNGNAGVSPAGSNAQQPERACTDPQQPQPAMGTATHGLPRRLARWRRDSLKAVGNSIVPQVAAAILRAWMDAAP